RKPTRAQGARQAGPSILRAEEDRAAHRVDRLPGARHGALPGENARIGDRRPTQLFRGDHHAPDFSATPWSDAALMLEVVGNQRLVWLHRNDGKLLLQNGAGG